MTDSRSGTSLLSRRPRRTGRGFAEVRHRSSAQERFDLRVHARRRRSWRFAGALLALALALATTWWVLWRSDWLLVERVTVTGADPHRQDAVLSGAAVDMSQPMVEVDTGSAESGVRRLPFVKDVEVRRSWPTTIVVIVTSREPVLAVRGAGGALALVDADGVTVETVTEAPEGVPLLVADGETGASEAAYQAAWTVLSALPEQVMGQVTSTTVTSADLVTLQLGERTIVWGGPEDSELKLEVVEALLAAGQSFIDVSAPRTPVTRPT